MGGRLGRPVGLIFSFDSHPRYTANKTMFHPIDDLHIKWTKVVLPPVFLEEEMPTSETASATVYQARHEICEILGGTDRRLLVVCGNRSRAGSGSRSTTGRYPSERIPSRSPNRAAPQLMSISRPIGSNRSLTVLVAIQLDRGLADPEPPRLGVVQRRRTGRGRDQIPGLIGQDWWRRPRDRLIVHAGHLSGLDSDQGLPGGERKSRVFSRLDLGTKVTTASSAAMPPAHDFQAVTLSAVPRLIGERSAPHTPWRSPRCAARTRSRAPG